MVLSFRNIATSAAWLSATDESKPVTVLHPAACAFVSSVSKNPSHLDCVLPRVTLRDIKGRARRRAGRCDGQLPDASLAPQDPRPWTPWKIDLLPAEPACLFSHLLGYSKKPGQWLCQWKSDF